MNKLSQIEYFLAVVDVGSFSGAADSLGCAASAPIRAVAALEERLGVQLFRRTTRKVSITEEGASYAVRCRAILMDLDEAEQHTRDAGSQLAGLLRVTAPVMLGHLHIAPLLAKFLGAHPKLTLDLQLSDQVLDLVEGAFDLGVRIGRLTDSSLIAQQVGQVRRVVCASPAYWRTYGKPAIPEDLAEHHCVNFDRYAGHHEWLFETQSRSITVRPRTVMSTNHLDAALQACMEGLGCGVFLSYQVATQLRDKSLVSVLAVNTADAMPVSLVSPPGRMMSERARSLKLWLAAELKKRLPR